jgi:hypothetical protein
MHADPEVLTLLALGEQAGTEDERRHTETCPECQLELSELRQVIDLGRSIGPETAMTSPSPAVWAKIQDELGFTLSAEAPAGPAPITSSSILEPVPAEAPAAALPTKHARRPLLSMLKAALLRSPRGSDRELTARARLSPVDATWSQASGIAELATDELGRRLLKVALTADLPHSGVRQAWLIHRDDPNVRQSLGVLDGPHGLWTVEHLIDLNEYSILDISQQGTGETEHSGQTIVRGDLTLIS